MAKLNIGSVLDELKNEILTEVEQRVVVFLRRNLKSMVIKILSDLLDVDDEGNITVVDKTVK